MCRFVRRLRPEPNTGPRVGPCIYRRRSSTGSDEGPLPAQDPEPNTAPRVGPCIYRRRSSTGSDEGPQPAQDWSPLPLLPLVVNRTTTSPRSSPRMSGIWSCAVKRSVAHKAHCSAQRALNIAKTVFMIERIVHRGWHTWYFSAHIHGTAHH